MLKGLHKLVRQRVFLVHDMQKKRDEKDATMREGKQSSVNEKRKV